MAYQSIYSNRTNQRLDELDGMTFSSPHAGAYDSAMAERAALGGYSSWVTPQLKQTINDIQNTKDFKFSKQRKLDKYTNKLAKRKFTDKKWNKKINKQIKTITKYKPYQNPYANQIDGLRGEIGNNGPYESKYQEQIDKWANALDSGYDPTKDTMYDYYRQAYVHGGQQAMQNAAAAAAANSGGFGNSYAQSQGQQAYNQHMAALTDRIPELAQAARAMYGANLEAFQNLDARDYQIWSDALADKYNQLNMWLDADNTAYGRYRDDLAEQYNKLGMYVDAHNKRRADYDLNTQNMFNLVSTLNDLRGSELNTYNANLDRLYNLGTQLVGAGANDRADYLANLQYLDGNVDMYGNAVDRDLDAYNSRVSQLSSELGILGDLENAAADRYYQDQDLALRQAAAEQAAAAASSGGGYGGGSSGYGGGYDSGYSGYGDQSYQDTSAYDDTIDWIERAVNEGNGYNYIQSHLSSSGLPAEDQRELARAAAEMIRQRDEEAKRARQSQSQVTSDLRNTSHGGSSRGYSR